MKAVNQWMMNRPSDVAMDLVCFFLYNCLGGTELLE